MKQYAGFVLVAVVLGLLALTESAQAANSPYEVEYTSDTPLIVIRFNQQHVRYEQSLYKTIASALDAKPSATFDVISISAKARDPKVQQVNNAIATENVHKVLATLHEIGLPQSRITLSSASDAVDYSEVRVFVH